MRFMFVASNPAGHDPLMLESEITELQKVFLRARGEPVNFFAFPDMAIEEFSGKLLEINPDILHISSHLSSEKLEFSRRDDQLAAFNVNQLIHIIGPLRKTPKLIYLNACDSQDMASSLIDTVPVAIGTTAPITNGAACLGAAIFYEHILAGNNLKTAFLASQALISTWDPGTRTELFARHLSKANKQILYQAPRIIARFESDRPPTSTGEFWLELGLLGCPSDVNQTVFFTNDGEYAEFNEEDSLEAALCLVVRDNPIRSVLWSDYLWYADGDVPIFATSVTGSGRHLTTSSTICDAIKDYYGFVREVAMPSKVAQAVQMMLQNDGSGLAASLGSTRTRSRTKNKKIRKATKKH